MINNLGIVMMGVWDATICRGVNGYIEHEYLYGLWMHPRVHQLDDVTDQCRGFA